MLVLLFVLKETPLSVDALNYSYTRHNRTVRANIRIRLGLGGRTVDASDEGLRHCYNWVLCKHH